MRPATGLTPKKRKPRRANVEASKVVQLFPDRNENVAKTKPAGDDAQVRMADLRTEAMGFTEFPLHKKHLFSVVEGMPVDDAVSHAACIVDGLREMAGVGVQHGITERQAWLMEANLEAVLALLLSVENASAHGRVA